MNCGGIQVVVSGDVYQLPHVANKLSFVHCFNADIS